MNSKSKSTSSPIKATIKVVFTSLLLAVTFIVASGYLNQAATGTALSETQTEWMPHPNCDFEAVVQQICLNT